MKKITKIVSVIMIIMMLAGSLTTVLGANFASQKCTLALHPPLISLPTTCQTPLPVF